MILPDGKVDILETNGRSVMIEGNLRKELLVKVLKQ